MEDKIKSMIQSSIDAKQGIPVDQIMKACDKIKACYQGHGKILVCGNGGSFADAQHMAAEFENRFRRERKPFPCLALGTNASTLTSIGNDYSFEEVFSKQVEAYGREGDVFIGISTSGNAKNVVRAAQAAKAKGLYVVGLLGRDGGKLKEHCDLSIIVPAQETARIQESHILIIHIICEILDEMLASN